MQNPPHISLVFVFFKTPVGGFTGAQLTLAWLFFPEYFLAILSTAPGQGWFQNIRWILGDGEGARSGWEAGESTVG